MMSEIELAGCTPTPLAHYLKALGVLRIVAEQVDANAAGRWAGDRFVLRTKLNPDAVEQFFLKDYCPTPIAAPWNGGSGFYPGDNKAGFSRLLDAASSRFAPYKAVLEASQACVQEFGFIDSPKDEMKARFLMHLRSTMPDEALPWLDASVMLTPARPGYPPLLGTGGNDGRLDFTNNLMQRLTELFCPQSGEASPHAASWLVGSLFGEPVPGLLARAVGQFSPGGVGGPNGGTGFEAGSLINPWDFVLMLEGALLFAGAATRRMESNESAALSYPFTVRATGSGSGAGNLSDESKSRAEIWTPLWERWTNLAEIRGLLGEGRVTLGRRAARDGLDFSRSVAGLGVDRGIAEFERYGFLMRSGKAYLATSLGRIAAQRGVSVANELINDLDQYGWLDRVRRFARSEHASTRMLQLLRRLEDALFALARRGGRETLQEILALLGLIEQTLSRSIAGREGVAPMPRLSEAWIIQADDRSHEFRIAVALAGIHLPRMAMRAHLAAVQQGFTHHGDESWCWDPASKLAVWGGRELSANLARVLERRLIEAGRSGVADKPVDGTFRFPHADLAAVQAFLNSRTDDVRISRLLGGLVCARLPEDLQRRATSAVAEPIPGAFLALKPLFVPDRMLHWLKVLPADACLPLHRQVSSWLDANRRTQLERAVEYGWRRLRIAGMAMPEFPHGAPSVAGLSGRRLLAALLIPLESAAVADVCGLLSWPCMTTKATD